MRAGCPTRPNDAARRRWLDLQMVNKQPMKAHLSGLELEYRILQLYAKEAGKREAQAELRCRAGISGSRLPQRSRYPLHRRTLSKVTFRVLDSNDKPTTGSFLIQRRAGSASIHRRPSAWRPDFFFHPQVYRADGESVALPPGKYTDRILARAGVSQAHADPGDH